MRNPPGLFAPVLAPELFEPKRRGADRWVLIKNLFSHDFLLLCDGGLDFSSMGLDELLGLL